MDDPPILCVIPYALPDATQAWELLNWMRELGGCKRHDCLLVVSAKVDKDTNTEILSMAASVFKRAELVTTPGNLPDERWPIGPNWMFQTAMNWVYQHRQVPFWWNEPDCIPLCEGWLDFIEQEYYRAGKPFMGCVVKGVTIGATVIPDSVNGCAVYPADTAKRLGSIQFNAPEAWDILAGPIMVPHAHHAKCYQYFWGEPGLAPTFRLRHEKGEPKNVFTLEQLRHDSVVFHRNKDNTLIPLLRTQRNGTSNIVHVVECHDPVDERTQRAVKSWEPLQGDRWRTIPVWKYPRSSQSIGDQRGLPMLKDLLQIGMEQCHKDSDIVCLTNGDNLLHVTLPQALEFYMADVPAICSFRLNVTGAPRMNSDPGVLCRIGKPDFGRDLFAFRRWWLEKNWALIPDMFLGEWEWDLILALLIRRSNGVEIKEKNQLHYGNPKSELPLGYVLHEIHERKWMSQEALTMPAKWHNQRLAKDWYKAQGMEQFYTLI
jgi:hypothetical protein